MSKVKNPEPVAEVGNSFSLLWAGSETISSIHDRLGVIVGDKLITTNQAEYYAAERVREALEQAAKTVLDGIDDDSSIAALATRRNAAEEIRALITKE